MSWQPTERELELAKRLDALEAQASRPVVAGGGLLTTVVNELISRVPRKLVTTALLVFLGWHGWDYFNRWQQLSAETLKLEAKAAALAADADAKGLRLDDDTLQTARMRAEVAKLQAEADKATAEADAQSTRVGNATIRLKSLQADIARTQAEADKAQAEADAQTQLVGYMPIAIRQKQAEVAEVEAEAHGWIEKVKKAVAAMRPLDNPGFKALEQILLQFHGAGGVNNPIYRGLNSNK